MLFLIINTNTIKDACGITLFNWEHVGERIMWLLDINVAGRVEYSSQAANVTLKTYFYFFLLGPEG